tara:strand:+ start:993 stop:1193 length:201 start_codon:yes stop_codon:yes gene_type:complete
MLRIIITSLLLVNSIFWGVYPPGDGSPHYLILNYFIPNSNPPNKLVHIILGVLFYLLALIVSHEII